MGDNQKGNNFAIKKLHTHIVRRSQIFKKFATLLLVLCVLISISACAREESKTIDYINNKCIFCGEKILEGAKYCIGCGESVCLNENDFVDYTILDSGICNTNISWEIRSDGTLYIFGTGTIPNYENYDIDGEIAPWKSSVVCSKIIDVVIGEGISGVGENAFYKMSLSNLYLGHNVITYESDVAQMTVENVYIPKSIQNAINLFIDIDNKNVQIYYEGTQEEWKALIGAYLLYFPEEYGYLTCNIHYNYEY